VKLIGEIKELHSLLNTFPTSGERRAFTAIFCLTVTVILLFMSPIIITREVVFFIQINYLKARCHLLLWRVGRVLKDRNYDHPRKGDK
jgi:hypothetical protein